LHPTSRPHHHADAVQRARTGKATKAEARRGLLLPHPSLNATRETHNTHTHTQLHTHTLSPNVRHSERSSMMCASATRPQPWRAVGGVRHERMSRACEGPAVHGEAHTHSGGRLLVASPGTWQGARNCRRALLHAASAAHPADDVARCVVLHKVRAPAVSTHALLAQARAVRLHLHGAPAAQARRRCLRVTAAGAAPAGPR
jgi:hypothetical protein